MANRSDVLFYKQDFSSASEATVRKMTDEIRSLPASSYEGRTHEQLALDLVKKHSAVLPTIDPPNIEVSSRDAEIEVGGHRSSFDYIDGPRRINGTAVDVFLPFTGDAELFGFTPSTRDFSPPVARVRGTCIEFTISGVQLDEKQVKSEIEQRVASIQKYLSNLGRDVATHDERLYRVALQELQARAEKLANDSDLTSKLGFKVRPKPGQ